MGEGTPQYLRSLYYLLHLHILHRILLQPSVLPVQAKSDCHFVVAKECFVVWDFFISITFISAKQ